MSDETGDDERVVVLGRGPVEGRDPGRSVRGVPLCGAVEGRTPDMDVREYMKRDTPVSLEVSRPGRMSKVVREAAICLKSAGSAGTGGGGVGS